MIPIVLNTRQRKIALALLKAESPLTISKLANYLHLSSRIIRYNLNTVSFWLQQAGVIVVKKPGSGIAIEAPKSVIKKLIKDIENTDSDDILFTKEQRIRSISLNLLTASQPLPAHTIAALSGVSRSTIFKDIRAIQKWMGAADYNIKVIQKKHVGLWIEGNESSRRSAIIYLIKEELGLENWHHLWTNDDFTTNHKISENPLFNQYIQKFQLSFAHKTIEWAERALGWSLTLDARVTMQVYLAITIHSLLDNRTVIGIKVSPTPKPLEHQIAELISAEIRNTFGMDLSQEEVDLLSVRLANAPRILSLAEFIQTNDELRGLDPQCLELAKIIANQAATYLHPWLNVDIQLVRGLALHFLPISSSFISYPFEIESTLSESIINSYPDVYGVADRAKSVLEKHLERKLPNTETYLITMHFVAALERLRSRGGRKRSIRLVCDGELSISSLLYARLCSEFPNLDVINLCMSTDKLQINAPNAELIISNVALPAQSIPVIQVSPILSQQDVNNIQRWLFANENQERKAGPYSTESLTVIDLLDLSSVLVDMKASRWQDVVNLASEPLILSKKIEPRYITAMQEAITTYGPYMVTAPGIILLHAKPSDGVNSLCLSLAILSTGVMFGHKEFDPVDIVFVLGAVDNRKHLTALYQLANLIDRAEFRSDLRKVQSSAEALRVIWRYLPAIPIT